MKISLLQTCRMLTLAGLVFACPIQAQLNNATFLGGSNDDRTYAVASDGAGFVFVAGHTLSTDFPATYSFLPPGPTGWNVFVSKLDSTLSQLVWSTVIGGSGDDEAFDIAVDSSGNVVVTGRTSSGNFPVGPLPPGVSPYDGSPNGANDAFLLKLSPNGSMLQYSTYLGGAGDDYALEVRTDSNGILTLAGCTLSANFPTSNAYQPSLGGMRDAFVARLDPAAIPANQLLYSTYLGGGGNDGLDSPSPLAEIKSIGLHVDAQGVITVVGPTASFNFPITPGAYQPWFSGVTDAFVTMVDPSVPPASQLTYSTFLGSQSDDVATSVDRVGPNRIVLGGGTYSGQFPVTNGAYDTSFNGTSGVDDYMFLAVLDRSQIGSSQLVYSTFIGGSSYEAINTLAVDSSGAIAFAGFTRSALFPTTLGALPNQFPPSPDNPWRPMAVIGRLNPAGAGLCDLEYATFIGGSTAQQVTDIALDPNLGVHMAGMTMSSDFPVTPGTYQTIYGGARDAWTAQRDLLPAGTTRWGSSTPVANGPLMFMGAGPIPAAGCFSIICRRAPALTAGALGYMVGPPPGPIIVLGAQIWIDPTSPTFGLVLPVTSDSLGGIVIPISLAGLPTPLGITVVAQFAWPDPATPGALVASDALWFPI